VVRPLFRFGATDPVRAGGTAIYCGVEQSFRFGEYVTHFDWRGRV
jgi:hypothetical protein